MPTCSNCKIEKTLECFSKANTTKKGYRSHCKQCDREYNSQDHVRERFRINSRRFRAKLSPDEYKRKNREAWRRWRYKISTQQYEEMFRKQNGSCAICGYQYTDGRILQIDHDHKTGEVRGLLCKKCNTYIGMIKENIEIIDRMKNYLNRVAA